MTVVLAALAFPAATLAAHLHVIQLPSGSCVVPAKNGNERYVALPEAAFKNTTEPTTTGEPTPTARARAPWSAGTGAPDRRARKRGRPVRRAGDYVNAP